VSATAAAPAALVPPLCRDISSHCHLVSEIMTGRGWRPLERFEVRDMRRASRALAEYPALARLVVVTVEVRVEPVN
jgi:hypothetical protein